MVVVVGGAGAAAGALRCPEAASAAVSTAECTLNNQLSMSSGAALVDDSDGLYTLVPDTCAWVHKLQLGSVLHPAVCT